ncbi:cytochrome P450 [bacterium]|nr:cytochrome P450 [bacterium]
MSKIPGPHRRYPGEFFLKLTRDPLTFFEQLAQRAPVNAIKMGPLQIVVLSQPELIQQVLVSDASNYVKGRGLEVSRRLLGQGLLTSENPLHKQQRQILQPIFKPRNLESFRPAFEQQTHRLLRRWPERGVISASTEMTRLTLEIIAQTLFGQEVDVDEVRGAMDEAVKTFRLVALPFYEWAERLLPALRHRPQRVRQRLDRVLEGILPGSLLQGTEMASEQLRDEAMTLFLAGHETTAHALTFALYLLSRHPEAQRRCAQDEAYLQAALLETLRLYPTAWIIGRRSLTSCQLGEYQIPPNTTVLMSPFAMHRHPDYFLQPERFRPERWLETPRSRLPKGVYFPFGGGPRVCIGEHFAWLEMLIGMRLILQNYWLEPCDVSRPKLRPAITLAPGQELLIPVRAA